ncbi:hypothetical protein [Streptomyces milbemycinicus]|uniref:hypothetical protein n=1 Tax=Streptomyces milbemycinicus TaxID=476552 RepID=UPI00117E7ADD|nr:hypothetical protein [Streptomyces milbemycinicus]
MPVGGNFTNCQCGPGAAVCEAPTQPVATVGLCLPDGTPIAVCVVRDCAGGVTSEGWINLTTGQFSVGAPPAGAMACGDSRAFELAGVLCDIAPATGDVLGLVLLQYAYNPDGSLASVTLLDAATGDPYTLQGELRHCPAAVEQPDLDLVVLCDTQQDGTRTSFVRDFRRDENGTITGHTDYTLDGAPYTPTGTVGQCTEPRVDVETGVLCLIDEASGNVVGRVLAEWTYDDQTGDRTRQRLVDLATGAEAQVPAGAVLSTCPQPDRITRQVCVVESGETEFLTNEPGAGSGVDSDWVWAPDLSGIWYPMYRVQPNPAWTLTDTDTTRPAHWVGPHADHTVCPTPGETSPPVPATWYTRASWNLPPNVNPDTIRIAATVLNADNDVVQWRLNDGPWQPVAAAGFNPPAWTFPPTAVPGGRPGMNDVIVQIFEAQPAACPSPNSAGMMLHVKAAYDYEPQVWTQVIEPGGQVYYLDETGARQDTIPPNHRLVPCAGSGDGACCPWQDAEVLTLCDTAADGTATAFLRHLTYTEEATAPAVTDTELDGVTPYTPAGTVGVCEGAEESCRNSSTLLLCDLPTDGTPTPTVTDTDPTAYFRSPPTTPVPGGAQVLWDGGSITIGPDQAPGPHPSGVVRTVAAIVQAARPACDTGMAHVKASVDVAQLGPTAGCGPVGWMFLFNGTTQVIHDAPPNNTPLGWTGTLTVGADVPAADLAAGQIAVVLGFDTYDSCDGITPSQNSWELSGFTTETTYDQTGCAEQVLATVVTDCKTGQVESVTYTTMDGTPYTPTGTIGQCHTAGGGQAPEPQPCPARSVTEACRCDDTDGDGVGDVLYTELWAVDTCNGEPPTLLGTYEDGDLSKPYTPTSPVDCTTDDEARLDGEPVVLCDVAPGGASVPFLRHVRYDQTGNPVGAVDTALDAVTPYTVTGTIGTCTAPPTPDAVVGTGLNRQIAAGTFDVKAAAPGLQSATVTVLTGTAQVTTSSGTVTIPAGLSLTWSVADDDDSVLSVLSVTVAAGADVVTNYTHKTTASG